MSTPRYIVYDVMNSYFVYSYKPEPWDIVVGDTREGSIVSRIIIENMRASHIDVKRISLFNNDVEMVYINCVDLGGK